MKHLSLLLLTCLSCTGLIYGMEKRRNKEHDLVGFSSGPGSRSLKLTALVGNSSEERRNCTELDLSSEKMEFVNLENVLSIFPNLETLKMSGCGLTKIDPITTSNSTLTSLDLTGNQLRKWQMSLVAKASALKTLNLSDNKIDEVNLIGAQKDLSLDLHNNDLLFIYLMQISREKPLAFLNLSGNNLTEEAYHTIVPYVPVDKKSNLFWSRVGNLVIAGSVGTVATLLGLYYSWYKEQDDRNKRGTWGTETEDKEETWGYTITSVLAGVGTTVGIYKKLNNASEKVYALEYEQWVKGIDLSHQQNGVKLLEDLEKK